MSRGFSPERLKHYPTTSGVYVMRDEQQKVLYVGKAKNLRSRLLQYFAKGGDGRSKVPYLVKAIAEIDTIVVPSEKDALLLEDTLIKQHQPKYNAVLKDDKTYSCLQLTKGLSLIHI